MIVVVWGGMLVGGRLPDPPPVPVAPGGTMPEPVGLGWIGGSIPVPVGPGGRTPVPEIEPVPLGGNTPPELEGGGLV